MTDAIQHRGFSLIDIFSPCVTFNHDNDYAFFRPRVRKLEDEGHDSGDRKSACEKALLWGDEIYIGKFLNVLRPHLGRPRAGLEEGGPSINQPGPAATLSSGAHRGHSRPLPG